MSQCLKRRYTIHDFRKNQRKHVSIKYHWVLYRHFCEPVNIIQLTSLLLKYVKKQEAGIAFVESDLLQLIVFIRQGLTEISHELWMIIGVRDGLLLVFSSNTERKVL